MGHPDSELSEIKTITIIGYVGPSFRPK